MNYTVRPPNLRSIFASLTSPSTVGVPDEVEKQLIRLWKWKTKHNITDSAFDDLRFVLPQLNILTSKVARRYIEFLARTRPALYPCCINSCLAYLGANLDLTHCPYCKEPKLNAAGKPRKFFRYCSVIDSLKSMFSNPDLVEKMAYRHRFESKEDIIQDIFDGKIYKQLQESNITVGGRDTGRKFFAAATDVALGMSTDGFAPFKSRKQTCWPLLLFNLNLPPDLRFLLQYIICCGVIPGPRKPKDFDSFMFPFVAEMLELALGVEDVPSLPGLAAFTLYAFLIFYCGDMPAVNMVMKMKGHNGMVPCRMCKIKGVLKPTGKKGDHTYYVPLKPPFTMASQYQEYDPLHLPLRTHNDFLREAALVDAAPTQKEAEILATLYGINGVSILVHLSSLFFPFSFPFDFMHLIYENLIKNLLDFFSGTFKDLDHEGQPYCLDSTVWEAIGKATAASGATIPGAYGARPRDFSKDRTGVTADMLSFWALYLGPIYLEKKFAKQEFYDHFVELVKLINLCLQFELHVDDLETIRQGFAQWVVDYER